MTAQELLREGQLDAALADLQQEVRQHPAEAKLRVFLFQLLAVQGQWDRALTQLNVVGELDSLALPMVQTYREAIRCEVLRNEVFAGKRTPLIFGEPPPWVALLLESLRLAAEGLHDQAGPLRDQAFEMAPAVSGTVQLATRMTDQPADEATRSEPFAWIADADSRLGPVLEAVVNGRYYWIPLDRVQRLEFEPPADLRDVVWMPGHFQWSNGGEAVALLPTRYPGSAEHEDPQIRLARRTQWLEPSPDVFFGLGQRLWSSDTDEFAVMDVRELTLDGA